jgi:hypothetical protein
MTGYFFRLPVATRRRRRSPLGFALHDPFVYPFNA